MRITDGTTPVNLTITAAANDSGAITQSYAAGATLTLSVQIYWRGYERTAREKIDRRTAAVPLGDRRAGLVSVSIQIMHKSAKHTPGAQANIHSQGFRAKISLDTASYKLYYVNYKIGLDSAPVDCLCNPQSLF